MLIYHNIPCPTRLSPLETRTARASTCGRSTRTSERSSRALLPRRAARPAWQRTRRTEVDWMSHQIQGRMPPSSSLSKDPHTVKEDATGVVASSFTGYSLPQPRSRSCILPFRSSDHGQRKRQRKEASGSDASGHGSTKPNCAARTLCWSWCFCPTKAEQKRKAEAKTGMATLSVYSAHIVQQQQAFKRGGSRLLWRSLRGRIPW